MKKQLFSLLKFLIGWPLSIVALFFIIKLILPQAPTLLSHMQQLNLPLLSYGIICFVLFNFLRSYLWYRLIRNADYQVAFKKSCFLWASSELKRYIPGNIWSFLGRTVLFAEIGVKKKDLGKLLIIEAELLLFGAGIVALLALPFFSLASYASTGLVCFALLIIILYIFNTHFRHFLKGKLHIVTSFILPTYNASESLFLVFLSTIAFLLFGLGHFFLINSFITIGPQLVWQITGFSVGAFLIGYLSLLTPAGFGVREGALLFGLAKLMSLTAAAFVSVFSRMILIISELIFVLLAFLWYKTKNIAKTENWIANHKHEISLFCFFLMYVTYFTTVTFLRYDNFYTGRFDLGNMAQTVWNTAHGRIFMFTNPNGTDIVSRLAFHADFILVLLAPFSMLWSSPKMLLLIQTLIVGAGSFFVYLIAKEVLKNKNVALLFAFIYLINPSIERTNLYDFHAVTLATTFLLGTYYFFMQKRYLLFLLFAFLAGICKEQVWLIIALFGPFLFFQHKKKLFGISLLIICVSLSYFLITYAIPHTLGSQHFALSYYADFGDSPVKIVKTIILSPMKTITTLLQPDRLGYLEQIFAPLGFLSLLAPVFLLFAGPDLFINLLSNNTQLHQIYYQYTATISPFLFIAAIYGVRFLKKVTAKQSNNTTLIIIYLLATSLSTAYSFGPLPGSREPEITMLTKPVTDREYIDNYLSHIRKRYSVAASNNIGSHLSQRQRIYALPLGVDKADVIVFLLSDAEPPQSLAIEKDLVQKLKKDNNYTLSVHRDAFIVFKKKRE